MTLDLRRLEVKTQKQACGGGPMEKGKEGDERGGGVLVAVVAVVFVVLVQSMKAGSRSHAPAALIIAYNSKHFSPAFSRSHAQQLHTHIQRTLHYYQRLYPCGRRSNKCEAKKR